MKTTLLLALAAITLTFTSCRQGKSSQDNTNEILYSLESESPDGLQRMKSMDIEDDVTWRGKSFHYMIHRMPCDSLPTVTDDLGDCYVDNVITLSIRREEGGQFLEKRFTKQSFSSVIEEGFLEHSILEGLVFDKETEQGLVFGASVSYPQSDLFIPVVITIAPNGSMTFRKEVSLEENYTEEEIE